ncbi:MAG: HDOD domain-containing protein [Candidatus Thiodiazotropha sp. (ex Dulcina madagascariensis)]|nr:HDOD domain-containing protein [Candidatus Thiodiazotropha sp. (ex Dulcina madagascariensis)]MCU7925092.1 HDOD domain-containing protein [Candidatus Thiodiazotropha sp. (ex Dulcina madagascariensis)]
MKTTESKAILFVDSDSNQLNSLKRTLHDYKDRWQMHFMKNAQQALEMMQQVPVDIVVSETQLDGMSGSELLKLFQLHYPSTTRLLFSGQVLRTPAQEVVHHAHQFIAKPCATEILIANLERVFHMRSLLNNPPLEELISSLGTLPSLPGAYQQMITALQSDATSVADIGRIVAQDIGMSTKVLQMVNSAFFGLPQQIASPEHAVSLLGIETVTNLALSAGIFTQLDESVVEEFQLEALWQHSLVITGLVRRLAPAAGLNRQQSEIPVLAGLLHDLGKLVLAAKDTGEYRRIVHQAEQDGAPLYEVEAESLWCSHATIGAYLMGLWGLPFPAVEAVALHHSHERQTLERVDCLVVYAANLLAHRFTDEMHRSYYGAERLQALLSPTEFERWTGIAEEYFDGKAA